MILLGSFVDQLDHFCQFYGLTGLVGLEASAARWLNAKEGFVLALIVDTHVLYGVGIGTKKFSLSANVSDSVEVFCGFG